MTTAGIVFFSLFLGACISVGYAKPPSQILNGSVALNIPYMAAMQRRQGPSKWGVMCGGAIIDANHILTAAHCIMAEDGSYRNSNQYRIVTGTSDILNIDWANVFRIHSVSVHQNYDPSDYSFRHDIGIIKLDRNITFTENQQPIALPNHDVAVGEMLMTVGFGSTRWNPHESKASAWARFLRKSYGTVISQAHCQQKFYDTDIIPGHLCISGMNAASPCTGDSGGPLVYSRSIVGIDSFGRDCRSDWPSVYTRVHQYLPWIRDRLATM